MWCTKRAEFYVFIPTAGAEQKCRYVIDISLLLDRAQGRPGRCYLLFFVYLLPRRRRCTYTDVHSNFPCHCFKIVPSHCCLHCETVILVCGLVLFLQTFSTRSEKSVVSKFLCEFIGVFLGICVCVCGLYVCTSTLRSHSSGFTFIGCLLLT